MSIKLLGTKIAIRPDQASGVSEGGIILPNAEKLTMGEAVAVGPGRYLENGTFVESVVVVGDKVAYTTGGNEIVVDGVQLLVIVEEQVIGVIS